MSGAIDLGFDLGLAPDRSPVALQPLDAATLGLPLIIYVVSLVPRWMR